MLAALLYAKEGMLRSVLRCLDLSLRQARKKRWCPTSTRCRTAQYRGRPPLQKGQALFYKTRTQHILGLIVIRLLEGILLNKRTLFTEA